MIRSEKKNLKILYNIIVYHNKDNELVGTKYMSISSNHSVSKQQTWKVNLGNVIPESIWEEER